MEDRIVKIIKLKIQKLHGIYNYDVEFNTDVTFIYGSNGCGKTTVLNITEAIITGQLFKLFNYTFETIELQYSSNRNIPKIKTIIIHNIKEAVEVEFEDKKYGIKKELTREEFRNHERDLYEMVRFYFNRYNVLNEIKNAFNYVYLPLNRSCALCDDDESNYFMMRRMHRIPVAANSTFELESPDLSMLQVEALINSSSSKINSNITSINDEFRDSILKSLLEVTPQESFDKNLIEMITSKKSVTELEKTKVAYLKILKNLNLLNDAEEDNYNNFFATLIEKVEVFKKNEHRTLSTELVAKFQDYIKIRKLVDIAKNTEEKKSKEREPIELFISTMNEFVTESDDSKKIDIDPMGRIYFTTQYSKKPISIQFLSSGEKQLVTFFANLIFKVKSNTAGIFVVDEPELSLHLSWQKIFVEKTLQINKNIQLVFATHSPEIIGVNVKKAFRLEKKYVISGEASNE